MYDSRKSTIADIQRLREKIEHHVSTSDHPKFAKRRCIVSEAHYYNLDKACIIWFLQQCSRGAAISGPIMQENGLQLFQLFCPDLHSASFNRLMAEIRFPSVPGS